MTKCIRDVIRPLNLPFFKLYVDDGYCRQIVDEYRNTVLEALNNFHSRPNFTVDDEPSRFLDSKLYVNEDRSFSVKVFHKPNKYSLHWSSQTPRRYKRNAIICELHRALVISDDFEEEVTSIKDRYSRAGPVTH